MIRARASIALADLLRARAQERWATIERNWLRDRREESSRLSRRSSRNWRSAASAAWRSNGNTCSPPFRPSCPATEVREIEQGYIPGESLVERLRRQGTNGEMRYFRTVKVGKGVTRTELEDETTREVFEAMWPLTAGRRLRKRRHVARDGALAWEVDEFTDRDLVLAEIELPSAEIVPDLPQWLAPLVVREVTGEPEYLNSNLAR